MSLEAKHVEIEPALAVLAADNAVRVWDLSDGKQRFGDEPWLEFFRYMPNFGFAKAPEGSDFAELKEAPEAGNDIYRCESMRAQKDLVLFCRVHGDQSEGWYGKLRVKDIVMKVPKDVKIIDGRPAK